MGLKKSMKPVVCILNTSDIFLGGGLKGRELAQLGQLADPAKNDFLLGRAALQLAGRKYLQKGNVPEPGELIVRKLQDGRPCLESHDQLFCSIAHSRGWAIGAISARRIGVDVERVRPHQRSLLGYIADPEEVDHIRDYFDHGTDEITIIWTIKESVMKGLGLGLQMNPRQFRITDKNNGDGVEVKVPGSGIPVWQVKPFRLGGYYFSIAYEKEHRQ